MVRQKKMGADMNEASFTQSTDEFIAVLWIVILVLAGFSARPVHGLNAAPVQTFFLSMPGWR
jgi:hypothetical protein